MEKTGTVKAEGSQIGIAAGPVDVRAFGSCVFALIKGSTHAGVDDERSPGMSERTTHETMVVTGIDCSTRNVMMQNADGEKPHREGADHVKVFDTLKVGDASTSITTSRWPCPGPSRSEAERQRTIVLVPDGQGGRMAGR